METLTDGLGQISKSDLYLHSLKHPQLLAKHSSDLVFDHSFCMVFKKYESLIVLQLSEPNNPHHSHENSRSDINSMGHMVNNHQSPNDVISRYKEVIRTQDETIEGCKQEIGELKDKNQEFQVIVYCNFVYVLSRRINYRKGLIEFYMFREKLKKC